MTRLIVQNVDTGRFLAPDQDMEPRWFVSLLDAAPGVVDDEERAFQLAQDWAQIGERVQIIDLDSFDSI